MSNKFVYTKELELSLTIPQANAEVFCINGHLGQGKSTILIDK